MIRFGGYFFTLFYLAGIFFPGWLTGWIGQLSHMCGHLAFAFFALLLARGARRTHNHFLYFARLLVTALSLELISLVARHQLGVRFEDRNALFTYACALSLIAGIAMALGCYRDLVAQVQPAGGQLNKKTLFGVPVNPGNYRIAPLPGLVMGLLTAGLSLFVSFYFQFSHGLYGLLYGVLAFMAMRDDSGGRKGLIGRSVFQNKKSLARTFIYTAGLAAFCLLLTRLGQPFKGAMPLSNLVTVAAVPLATLFPDNPKPSKVLGRFYYAGLPLAVGLFSLIRYLI